jgi:hypothetical protein
MFGSFGILEFYPSLIATSNSSRSFFKFIFKAKPL